MNKLRVQNDLYYLKKMNILFIGHFYPKNIISTIIEDTHGKVGFSNHNFEISLIHGFAKQPNVVLRVLTAPMVFSYPYHNKKAFIKNNCYKEKGYLVRSIGFCNIALINIVSEIYALSKAIKQEILKFDGDEVKVIVNTPSLILSSALFNAIKKIKGKNIKTALIVPDIPECIVEMNGKRSIKDILVQKMNKYNAKLSKHYDKYVYLTEAMNDFYRANPNNYIVMEGLIDEQKINTSYSFPNFENNKEIILYTGTLRRIFGVMELIDSYEKANLESSELWICGSGECDKEIERRAKINSKIKFLGLVSSKEALELQSQATILANPRSSNGRYTKYSFPSKTIEYLLAGRTVIMNRLPGIPKEYNGYIEYPDNNTIESWARKLIEITKEPKEQRLHKSKLGHEFIINNKTAVKQCKRIIDLVSRAL